MEAGVARGVPSVSSRCKGTRAQGQGHLKLRERARQSLALLVS